MLALHNEFLTRRYLLYRLKLLEGIVGFGLGIFCDLKGHHKLRPLLLRITLQGLVFFDEILELLLNLIDTGLLLLALNVLLGRFIFGLGQRLLQGRHLGRGPWQIHDDHITLQPNFFLMYRQGIAYLCSPRAASW